MVTFFIGIVALLVNYHGLFFGCLCLMLINTTSSTHFSVDVFPLEFYFLLNSYINSSSDDSTFDRSLYQGEHIQGENVGSGTRGCFSRTYRIGNRLSYLSLRHA